MAGSRYWVEWDTFPYTHGPQGDHAHQQFLSYDVAKRFYDELPAKKKTLYDLSNGYQEVLESTIA